MNEIQRQAYLKIMGIQGYFPRSVLPGARPSPVYASQDYSDASDTETPAKASLAQASNAAVRERGGNGESAPAPYAGRAAEALANAGSLQKPRQDSEAKVTEVTKAPVVPGKPDPADAESAELEPAELRFRLQYYKISASLAIIDETPHHLSGSVSTGAQNPVLRTKETRELLLSIVAALGVDAKDNDLTPELFNWPLVESMSVQGDPVAAARNALQGFIQGRHDKDKFSNLVIFAGQIAALIEPTKESISPPEADDDISHKPKSAGSEFFISLTTSFHSMLAFPLLKRDVWQQLQPLRKRLVSSDSTQTETAPQ